MKQKCKVIFPENNKKVVEDPFLLRSVCSVLPWITIIIHLREMFPVTVSLWGNLRTDSPYFYGRLDLGGGGSAELGR